MELMETSEIKRDILPGGKIRLSAEGCSFTYEAPVPGALLVTINGHDRGQFGTSTLDEILITIQKEGVIELFVDARNAAGISVPVSDSWTRFFALNKDRLKRVHVLVASQYIQLTVAIAQHLSNTGNLIRIHSSGTDFMNIMHGGKDVRSGDRNELFQK